MKQEDKDLLLKDLCARLPYGVKVGTVDNDGSLENIWDVLWYNTFTQDVKVVNSIEDAEKLIDFSETKPYLFPLSCMTKEQRREFNAISRESIKKHMEGYRKEEDFQPRLFHAVVEIARKQDDWLNRNHFDSLGLIEKSLALDATNLMIYE